MFIEIAVVACGVPVLAASTAGLVLARLGRAEGLPVTGEPGEVPQLAVVTEDLVGSGGVVDDLPLVAPARAEYGTATRMLVEAARSRRAPVTARSRFSRAA